MYDDYNNMNSSNSNNTNNTNNTNSMNGMNSSGSTNGSSDNENSSAGNRDYVSYSEKPLPNGNGEQTSYSQQQGQNSGYVNAGSTGTNTANSNDQQYTYGSQGQQSSSYTNGASYSGSGSSSYGNQQYGNGSSYGSGSYGTGSYGGGSYGAGGNSSGSYGKPHYTSYQYSGSNGAGAHIPPEDGNRKKKDRKPAGFWKKAVMCVALGLIFGLCAGGGLFLVNTLSGTGTKQVATTQSTPVTTTTASADSAVASSADKKITTTTSSTSGTTVTDVSSVATDVMPAVVAITNDYTETAQDWFGQQVQQESEASGSGIIVGENDSELLIATNNHVVSEADKLSVQFIDGSTAEANLKGGDEDADIAVIAVALDSLSENTINSIKIATLGDSDTLQVGEPAIAIGNALGYGQSVTSGVISALNREVTLDNGTHSLIQTDAAINPGNSGGALLNTKGELIGINEAKAGGSDVEGMGYAIPISTAKPIIDELMNKETKTKVNESEQAYLGIGGVDVTSDVASTYNMPEGIYVAQVEDGSAAANAGIVKGDIITKFDDQTVGSMEDLKDLMQYYKSGQTVNVTMQVQNAGGYSEQVVSVTLGQKSTQQSN